MRAFVAIPLSAAVWAKIAEFYETLGEARGLKLVPPQNLHLTLDFLGELSPARAEKLCNSLAAVAATARPFRLAVKGTGAFPRRGSPRVLWLGVEREPALFDLAAAVRIATGSKEQKSFSPHLTVARVKVEDPGRERFFKEFFKYGDFSFGVQEVTSFFLMESDLSGKVPVYNSVKEFKMKDGVVQHG